MPDLWELFGNMVFAPVTETAILVILLMLLGRTSLSAKENALVCALAFAILHGVLQGWLKAPAATWSFYFFAAAFLKWRSSSLVHGVLAALVPHALVNAAAMGILALYALQ